MKKTAMDAKTKELEIVTYLKPMPYQDLHLVLLARTKILGAIEEE